MTREKFLNEDKVRASLKKEILSIAVLLFEIILLISETDRHKQDKSHKLNKKSLEIVI